MLKGGRVIDVRITSEREWGGQVCDLRVRYFSFQFFPLFVVGFPFSYFIGVAVLGDGVFARWGRKYVNKPQLIHSLDWSGLDQETMFMHRLEEANLL